MHFLIFIAQLTCEVGLNIGSVNGSFMIPVNDPDKHLFFNTQTQRFETKNNSEPGAGADRVSFEKYDYTWFYLTLNGKRVCRSTSGNGLYGCKWNRITDFGKWKAYKNDENEQGYMIVNKVRYNNSFSGTNRCLAVVNSALRLALCNKNDETQRFAFQ